MTLNVVTVGPLNVDLFITGNAPTNLNELTQWIGPSNVTVIAAGSTGYATLAFAKLGLRTGVVAVLADDTLGDVVHRDMVLAGVDISHVTRQPYTQSGIGIYLLLFGDKKRPLTYRYPTHFPWPNPCLGVPAPEAASSDGRYCYVYRFGLIDKYRYELYLKERKARKAAGG